MVDISYLGRDTDPGTAMVANGLTDQDGGNPDNSSRKTVNVRNNYPICNYYQCFACLDKQCRILTDNYFGGKPCPFFKSKSWVEKERKNEFGRMQNGGIWNFFC